MSIARILDGRALAARIKERLARELAGVARRPRLAILSFEQPATNLYRAAQLRACRELGIEPVGAAAGQFSLDPDRATQEQVEAIIQGWNADATVHGIFVHQPLPRQIEAQRLSAIIDPRKDVEGIHPHSSARRFFAKARIGSCTALAVMELIDSTGVDLEGVEAVVVGHSEIVGRPVGMLLLDRLATTTICHAATASLEAHVRRADVLVVAVGRPHLIPGAWIKPGAIVIDVGINVLGGHVVGDVEFEEAKARAGFITPVPGGVGPVTVMMVMQNALEAFKLQGGA